MNIKGSIDEGEGTSQRRITAKREGIVFSTKYLVKTMEENKNL